MWEVPSLPPLFREVTWPRTHSYKQDTLKREGEKLLREHLLGCLEPCSAFQEPGEVGVISSGSEEKDKAQEGEGGGWSHRNSVGEPIPKGNFVIF